MPCCAIAAALLGQPFVYWVAVKARLVGAASVAAAPGRMLVAGRFSTAILSAALTEAALVGAGIAGAAALFASHAGLPHAFHICTVLAR